MVLHQIYAELMTSALVSPCIYTTKSLVGGSNYMPPCWVSLQDIFQKFDVILRKYGDSNYVDLDGVGADRCWTAVSCSTSRPITVLVVWVLAMLSFVFWRCTSGHNVGLAQKHKSSFTGTCRVQKSCRGNNLQPGEACSSLTSDKKLMKYKMKPRTCVSLDLNWNWTHKTEVSVLSVSGHGSSLDSDQRWDEQQPRKAQHKLVKSLFPTIYQSQQYLDGIRQTVNLIQSYDCIR